MTHHTYYFHTYLVQHMGYPECVEIDVPDTVRVEDYAHRRAYLDATPEDRAKMYAPSVRATP